MARLKLDDQGRLLELMAIPTDEQLANAKAQPNHGTSWSDELVGLAGIDANALKVAVSSEPPEGFREPQRIAADSWMIWKSPSESIVMEGAA